MSFNKLYIDTDRIISVHSEGSVDAIWELWAQCDAVISNGTIAMHIDDIVDLENVSKENKLIMIKKYLDEKLPKNKS